MTTVSMMLLLLAIGLLVAEMFMPGFGVCGITGLVLFIISSVITMICVPFGVFIVIGEVTFLSAFGIAMWKYIKKRQLYGKIILDETLNTDVVEIGDPEYFMGKIGLTKTPLKPFGFVDFNGTVLEVSSDGPYIREGMQVKVVETGKNKIIVRLMDTKIQ